MNKKGECLMNWDDSQLVSSAFAKGHGGLSLGQRWGLASILRGNSDYSSREDLKSAKKKRKLMIVWKFSQEQAKNIAKK